MTGNNSGEMDWRYIDATALVGEQARIVVRDDHSGGDWGHLMVDDIRFSDTAAGPRDTQTTVNLLVGGEVVVQPGSDSESLDWASWDLQRPAGSNGADHGRRPQLSGGWGHIRADQFMLASRLQRHRTCHLGRLRARQLRRGDLQRAAREPAHHDRLDEQLAVRRGRAHRPVARQMTMPRRLSTSRQRRDRACARRRSPGSMRRA